MKNSFLKSLVAFGIVSIFIALSFGSGEEKKEDQKEQVVVDVENESVVKKFIQGKWSTSFYSIGTTWYYRFDISQSEIKYWVRYGEWDWKTDPDNTLPYSLTHVMRDTYGKKLRGLYIENTTLDLRRGGGLTFEDGCLKFNSSCLTKGW